MSTTTSAYQIILCAMRNLSRNEQVQLIETLINELQLPATPDDTEEEVSLETLKKQMAAKPHPAMRRYSAKEAAGVITLKEPLSLTKEKAVLEQALLRKYG